MEDWLKHVNRYLRSTVAAALLSSLAIADEIRDYYAEPGLNPFKGSLNQNFKEHIDPFSGTLQLHYTDLVIPGPAGFDIAVNRSYTNLQLGDLGTPSSYGAGWTMHFGRLVVPALHADKICTQSGWAVTTRDNPSFERPDGGREILVLVDASFQEDVEASIDDTSSASNVLISKNNWRLECVNGSEKVITSPGGTRYILGELELLNPLDPDPIHRWYTTRVEDVHGNGFDIVYDVSGKGVYIDYVQSTGSHPQLIDYSYIGADTSFRLNKITANGQEWTYEYEEIENHPGHYQLKKVVRPEAGDWEYSYYPPETPPGSDRAHLNSLNTVTYPFGGTITYEYVTTYFDVPVVGPNIGTTTIRKKTTGGSGIESGIWMFNYEPGALAWVHYITGANTFEDSDIADGPNPEDRTLASIDRTVVETPTAQLRYYHYGVRSNAPNWAIGLLSGREVYPRNSPIDPALDPTNVIEQIRYDWTKRLISTEKYWHGRDRTIPHEDNAFTHAPMQERVFHWRDKSEFETAHDEYDVYGNAGKVTETSNRTNAPDKVTHFTFFDPFDDGDSEDIDPWIVNQVEDEQLDKVLQCGDPSRCPASNAPSATIDRTFNSDTGVMTEENRYGVITRYTYDGNGNMATSTDAEDNLTTYLNYKRGIAQRIEKEENVILTREVNSTGTLKSETNGRGHKTSYTYDMLNRLETIDYPINADVIINWTASNRTLTRGDFQQVDTFDGFGRITQTERSDTNPQTSETIVTNIAYDSLGQTKFESYPNSTNGTYFKYDEFGRVLRVDHVTDSGTAFKTFAYDKSNGANEVIETNERGKQSTYIYRAYGSPDGSKSLIGVVRDVSDSENDLYQIVDRNLLNQITSISISEIDPNAPTSNPRQLLQGSTKLRTFVYDSRYYLVEEFHPETGVTLFGRDNVGNMTCSTIGAVIDISCLSASSPITVYDYDKLNRLDVIDYPDGTPDTDYIYDRNDNVKELVQGSSKWVYEYDENDNLENETLTIDTDVAHEPIRTFNLSYGRNALDAVSSITYPNGEVIEYAPDALGRPTQAGTHATDIGYHANGSIHAYNGSSRPRAPSSG